MRLCLAQLNPTVGALKANADAIIAAIAKAKEDGADLILFSELALCGYPPEDLLLIHGFIEECEAQLARIAAATHEICAIVGTARRGQLRLRNSAAVIQEGQVMGFCDKVLLPTYDVFDEQRYFEPGEQPRLWEIAGEKVALTICEDIWGPEVAYPRDPVTELIPLRPTLLLNLSASPYSFKRGVRRLAMLQQAAKALAVPAALCNQVGGNDSLIFAGASLAVTSQGEVTTQLASFAPDQQIVSWQAKEIPSADPLDELYQALLLGLRDYFAKQGFSKAVLGLSGGIDSSLVACLAVDALGADNVLGVLMPSRYTSQASSDDAIALAQNLGIATRTESIEPLFSTFSLEGVAAENVQARIRGMLLMAISNSEGHIVLSTGNKSETALGYSTLYGDMVGGLAVINDVSKQQVYALCTKQGSRIPPNVLTKAPSAELRADQKDSDTLPDYAIIDAVLEDTVEHHLAPEEIAATRGFTLATVQDLVRRIHQNEYKRRQAAPGLRVTEKAFSAGRRFPIVQHWT